MDIIRRHYEHLKMNLSKYPLFYEVAQIILHLLQKFSLNKYRVSRPKLSEPNVIWTNFPWF